MARDNTVRYGWHALQLLPDSNRRSFAGTHIEVREYHDGRLEVVSNDTVVSITEAPPKATYFNSPHRTLDYDAGNVPKWLENIMRQRSHLSDHVTTPGSTTTPHATIRQQARWDAVQEARGHGLSQRAMAKLLGMSRRTVKKYKTAMSPPTYPFRLVTREPAGLP